jgi:hypothetical protein
MHISLQKEDRKIWAETMYTRKNCGLDYICSTLGETKETIQQWATTGQWEKQRLSLLTSRSIQLECLFQLLDVATKKVFADKENLKSKDADIILKYTRAIQHLQTRIGMSQVLDGFDAYFNWLQQEDLELAKQVGATFDSFTNHYLKVLENEA